MGFDFLPDWKLDEYCRECAGMVDVKRFDCTAVDGRKVVIYNRKCFERDTASETWNRLWPVLSRWCVGIFDKPAACEHVIHFV